MLDPERPARSAVNKLLALGLGPAFRVHQEAAMAAFWGDWLEGLGEAEAAALIGLQHAQAAYACWACFDLPTPAGPTIAERLLAGEGAPLTAGERAWLRRMSESHLALYEVEAVRPGEGFSARDLWTEDRIEVHERTASRQLVRWDLLAARLVPESPGGPVLMEGGAYPLPITARTAMLRTLRRARRDFARRMPGADDRAFWRRQGYRFNHFWLEHVALRPPLRVVTAEGDDIVLARAIFDVRDGAALAGALAAHPELTDEGQGVYAWTEAAARGRRRLGTVRLEARRLAVETLSAERADRARHLLEAAAGDALRYRATRLADPGPAGRRAPEETAPVPPDVEARLVHEFKAQHYRDWPDRPLPALRGRTPREAARLPKWRPRLIELLKWMENQEARHATAARPAYDFGWVWRELGIEP